MSTAGGKVAQQAVEVRPCPQGFFACSYGCGMIARKRCCNAFGRVEVIFMGAVDAELLYPTRHGHGLVGLACIAMKHRVEIPAERQGRVQADRFFEQVGRIVIFAEQERMDVADERERYGILRIEFQRFARIGLSFLDQMRVKRVETLANLESPNK